ncbi:hypothetical protein G7072_15790 [Nocardioides sp. HDW12B]|uniref:hypothetical protein n=1 Tax=Nocardioides sp. HDW12B TaxID=2714939 RepID=UPI00140C8E2F|nr:hypothetical protein [Nocardioides sp. HDW12B]QIK67619.1 hypothetical protein G7072_15790 [Nocardioides sp. HDW12B]
MRLSAALLVLCFALSGCGGGEDESAGSESGSSSSESPEQATTEDAGDAEAGMSDAELCTGPLQDWLEADAAASTKLQEAGGNLDEAEIEEILAESDASIEALAGAENEELASLAAEIPQLNKDFALAFAGDGASSAEQSQAIKAITDAKASLLDTCLDLSTQ